MELIVLVGIIWVLVVLFKGASNNRSNRTQSSNHTNNTSYTNEATYQKRQDPQTYRPTNRPNNSSNITFRTPSSNLSSTNQVPSAIDLDGLHDAFTGAPLDKSLGLHQCQSCKVYYHTDSLQVLIEANNSQCVSCQSTNIIAVVSAGRATGGSDFNPILVTLNNYKSYEGSVVTFEGFVHSVNESRRGNDFAVMFENKSWARGFKLVFFRGAVQKVGGPNYIKNLSRKNIKVRGLVVKHPKFGYEIIVSEKSMIISVT